MRTPSNGSRASRAGPDGSRVQNESNESSDHGYFDHCAHGTRTGMGDWITSARSIKRSFLTHTVEEQTAEVLEIDPGHGEYACGSRAGYTELRRVDQLVCRAKIERMGCETPVYRIPDLQAAMPPTTLSSVRVSASYGAVEEQRFVSCKRSVY